MTAEPAAGPLSPAYRLLTVLLVAQVTMVAFESMAVSTAMPTVAVELGAVRSFGLAFSLMLSGLLLGSVVAGLWCDRDGPLPALLTGQVLFGLGGLGCGFATGFGVLLAGRVLTGLGGGLLVVALYVAIGRAYPGSMHPQVFGWISAAWVLPSIVGPLLAGALTEHLTWRWVFWCVVPLAVITTAATWVRRTSFGGRTDGARRGTSREQLVVAATGATLALSAGLLQWGSQHLRPVEPVAVAAAAAGLVGVALTAPRLVPAGTARMARGLPSVMLARFLLTAGFNGAVPFVPLMLTAERDLTSTWAGVVLMLASIGWSAGSALQARDHGVDRHLVLGGGGALLGAGLSVLAVSAALGLPAGVVAAGLVVTGLGMGLGMTTISVLGLELSPVADHGRTSASLQLADSLGSALGVAVTGALFAALHRAPGADGATYATLWAACAVIGAVAWFTGERSRPC